MAKLSQKQIQRQDDMWKLEEQAKQIVEEIAEMVAEPTTRLDAVRVAIGTIEDNIPESCQDAWYDRDSEHIRDEEKRVGYRPTYLPTSHGIVGRH